MTAPRLARLPLASLALLVALAGCPAPEGPQGAQKPASGESAQDDEQAKTLYAFGASLARYAAGMKLSESEVEQVKEGLEDALLKRPLEAEPRDYGAQLQKFVTERRAAAAAEEKEAAAAFLAEEAEKPGVEKTASGLLFESLSEGTGESPEATDRVKVHYTGTLRDGTEFDSSTRRGEPASFHLNRVVPCWTEALQKMKVGGKARIVCPSELGYGERGVPGRIPAGAALVFEVELLEILPETASAPRPGGAAKPAAKPAAKAGAKPPAAAGKPAAKPAPKAEEKAE